MGEVVCGWKSGMGWGRQLGELGLLLVLFTCLAASSASSRGCTSNVCLDFLKCLVPEQESSLLSDSEPPLRFCCSFNQFQPALCSFVSAGIWHKVCMYVVCGVGVFTSERLRILLCIPEQQLRLRLQLRRWPTPKRRMLARLKSNMNSFN